MPVKLQIGPGSQWELRRDRPKEVIQVLSTEMDEHARSLVTYSSADGTHVMSRETFLKTFQPTREAPTSRDFFDILRDDDACIAEGTSDDLLVSSALCTEGPSHDTVKVWNRRGLAGTLTVCKGDGAALVKRLLGHG
jgi:hypothetical protein